MEANIRFTYASGLGGDVVVVTDVQGRMVQLSIDQAVKMSEWIGLNTKVEKKYSFVSGIQDRGFNL